MGRRSRKRSASAPAASPPGPAIARDAAEATPPRAAGTTDPVATPRAAGTPAGTTDTVATPRGARTTTPRRPPAPPTRRARLEDAPKAPWSPFPLVELTILFGIVLIVLGFAGVADRRALFLVCGFALVTLAALELSLREHFAGYRSHSTLLAGAAAVVVDVPLFFLTSLPQEVLLIVGVAVFGVAFYGLRSVFRRRTGGIGFRA
ncbi:hypothetical protein [Capillimicrobium parvum]|uniref:Uncharacterized protein n=1 Tax=Capillimicrobium parvum TaxID=2884022 RepID=A0A9E6Y0S8_9ACTN|nr:hypothetical protein [Capillimicrobium parvum]UGS37989.1 hypothetical protein DSM104329_04411 [Capillimicrobium parvum]